MLRTIARIMICNLRLLKENGYLNESGWINSIRSRQSVDGKNRPIPWVSFPFFEFLKDRLIPEMELFEYGSGNSTLYWAGRFNSVVSIEHDNFWYRAMKIKLPGNVIYQQFDIGNGYVEAIERFGKKFDIIFIDGRERVACAKFSFKFLKQDGVIIWDNSLREKYKNGISFLRENGFSQIDFKGLNPMGTVETVTTVFYRQPNCLKI